MGFITEANFYDNDFTTTMSPDLYTTTISPKDVSLIKTKTAVAVVSLITSICMFCSGFFYWFLYRQYFGMKWIIFTLWGLAVLILIISLIEFICDLTFYKSIATGSLVFLWICGVMVLISIAYALLIHCGSISVKS